MKHVMVSVNVGCCLKCKFIGLHYTYSLDEP